MGALRHCTMGVVVALAATMSCVQAAPRAVVLTTDIGADMDDQWALAHLVASPDIDVRAVITTHTGRFPALAPPAAESSARIARDELDRLSSGRRPPVFAGSSVALSSRTALDNPGVGRIISESRAFSSDHRLAVLVIGAATDTASALLEDRQLSERVEIVAMGFNTCAKGGDTFNVVNDPIAWQVVLDSDTPITIGDSSVTRRDLVMTSDRAHALLEPAGAKGQYLARVFDQWLLASSTIVQQVMGDTKSWPVWDEVTVAYLLGMTTIEHRARPKLGTALAFIDQPNAGSIACVATIDSPRLWADFVRRLGAVDAAKPQR
jgi:inosine-uridine nucleoside N-ribohydrolase